MSKVQLKDYQYTVVDSKRDIVYVHDTGDYAKKIGGEIFEVLATAQYEGQPVMGKREDVIIMDDVSTPLEVAAEKYKSWMESDVLYGTSLIREYNQRMDAHTAILNEVRKPSGILNFMSKSSKTPAYKENEMEIGGHYCHLCGAEILQENRDTVYKKKNHIRVVNRYMCGTIVEKKFKSSGEGTMMEDKGTKVILGDNCVEV